MPPPTPLQAWAHALLRCPGPGAARVAAAIGAAAAVARGAAAALRVQVAALASAAESWRVDEALEALACLEPTPPGSECSASPLWGFDPSFVPGTVLHALAGDQRATLARLLDAARVAEAALAGVTTGA
jgi:hypothetical protein